MPAEEYRYPYDPTGNSPDNLVENELHTLTTENGDNYKFIVPLNAPYFKDTLVVTHPSTSRILTAGVDYIHTHEYISAKHDLGECINGSITFLNKTISGTIYLNYQTLGGAHLYDTENLLVELSALLLTPDLRTWEDVSMIPDVFTPQQHVVFSSDLVGMSDVVEELKRLRLSITGFGEAYHVHEMAQINGLLIKLAQLTSNAGNHKLAPSNGYTVLNHTGSIGIVLPQFAVDTRVLVKFEILSENEPAQFEVSGLVRSKFDSQPNDTWKEARTRFVGHDFTRKSNLTYNDENHPVILLGKNFLWTDCHVVITSITIDSSIPVNYIAGWEVFLSTQSYGKNIRVREIAGLDGVKRYQRRLKLNALYGRPIFPEY